VIKIINAHVAAFMSNSCYLSFNTLLQMKLQFSYRLPSVCPSA